MILPDVNVLVYAHWRYAPEHRRYREWLDGVIASDESYGIADVVLSGVIRIVTHPRIFSPPSTPEEAVGFAAHVRGQPNCVPVHPGPRHWEIFTRLCRESGARGNLVPDAFLAALAIESGSEWITTDGDFGRFRGLRWRRPFD
jgi:toxin-antitoxin system PIN domain toxin